MKILILLLFLMPLTSNAGDNWNFEFDYTKIQLEHAWRGPDNYAQFLSTLDGIGLTAWHKSGFGTRLGYIKGEPLNTEGRFSGLTLGLDYIVSLELLYRKEILEGLFLIGGVGTHIIPIPVLGSTNPHHSTDYDNDEGYILGVQWKVNKHFSVGWRFTHYSRIKSSPYDEWIKGHSLNITYIF